MSAAEGTPWRALLALAMAVFPTVYLWKLVRAEPTPAPMPEPPTAMNLIVLTVGTWPDPTALPPIESLTSIDSRGVRVGPLYAASDDPAASAVSLWTGRFVPHHGVTDGTRSLPPLAWTLAGAARASGTRTAAFLQTPYVTRQGLGGFETVVEGGELGPQTIGELARDFLARHARQTRLVWLHLDQPGPGGAFVEAALGPVLAELDQSGDRVDSSLVVTALTGREGAWMEGAARVPLLVELPTAYSARRRGAAHLSHVDLTAVLRRVMHLPLPDAARGQAPLQGRAEAMWTALRGGDVAEWVWIEGSFGHALRRPGAPGQPALRVVVAPTAEGEIPELEASLLLALDRAGRNAPSVPTEQQDAARQAYLDVRRTVYAGAVESVGAGR